MASLSFPRSLLALLALAGTLALARPTAHACKCMIPEPGAAISDASVVFEGRVLELAEVAHEGLPQRRAGLAVVRTWKGLSHDERVDVITNDSSAACGFPFEAGASYLIYAREHEGKLHVSSCSRTAPMEQASDDLRVLGAGSTPVQVKSATPVIATPVQSASSPAPDTHPPQRLAPRPRAGCGGGHAQGEAASLFFLLPALGLLVRRRDA